MIPGFADPVEHSQSSFRALLDAMARPGMIHRLAAPLTPPAPLHQATAATLLTLLDAETTLWLAPEAAPIAPWLAFHAATPLAPRETAAFALALAPIALASLNPGTDDAPQDSATLILQVPAIGTGPAYRIQGPGLPASTLFRAEGLPDAFPAEWSANHALFPRGIDLILCGPDSVAALPRTLRLEPA